MNEKAIRCAACRDDADPCEGCKLAIVARLKRETKGRRVQHSEVPVWVHHEAGRAFRTFIARAMNVPESRIKRIDFEDPGLEGRTGIRIDFEPGLSKHEEQQLRFVLRVASRVLGGRAPIFPGSA